MKQPGGGADSDRRPALTLLPNSIKAQSNSRLWLKCFRCSPHKRETSFRKTVASRQRSRPWERAARLQAMVLVVVAPGCSHHRQQTADPIHERGFGCDSQQNLPQSPGGNMQVPNINAKHEIQLNYSEDLGYLWMSHRSRSRGVRRTRTSRCKWMTSTTWCRRTTHSSMEKSHACVPQYISSCAFRLSQDRVRFWHHPDSRRHHPCLEHHPTVTSTTSNTSTFTAGARREQT